MCISKYNQNMYSPWVFHLKGPLNLCKSHVSTPLYVTSKIFYYFILSLVQLHSDQREPCPLFLTFQKDTLNVELFCTVWHDLALFTNVKKKIEWNPLYQKYNLLSLSLKALEIQFLFRRLASGSLHSRKAGLVGQIENGAVWFHTWKTDRENENRSINGMSTYDHHELSNCLLLETFFKRLSRYSVSHFLLLD